jgi:hypothetical protein
MQVKYEKGFFEGVGILCGIVVGAVVVASWLTHVVVCLKTGSWGFLIAGAIFFPIGIVHGIGIWFGFW